jgi:hypothetical protein
VGQQLTLNPFKILGDNGDFTTNRDRRGLLVIWGFSDSYPTTESGVRSVEILHVLSGRYGHSHLPYGVISHTTPQPPPNSLRQSSRLPPASVVP